MKLFAVLLLVVVFASKLAARDPASAAKPPFVLEGEKWTYTNAGRSFAGYLVKPDGTGPFPAVIINHGKGGRPEQFSLDWAREMVRWGLVAICPTHVAGTDAPIRKCFRRRTSHSPATAPAARSRRRPRRVKQA